MAVELFLNRLVLGSVKLSVDTYTYGTVTHIGEIRKGAEIGYSGKYANKYIWLACATCGKERWVRLTDPEPMAKRCHRCATQKSNREKIGKFRAEKSVNWQGGRRTNRAGYWMLKLRPEDFFYSMAGTNGYVFEHRLVVAKALGRCLHRWEIVHHKGVKYPKGSIDNKQDNRYPDNLQIVTDDRHNQITILENRIALLEKRVSLLEAENVLLRSAERMGGNNGCKQL